MDATACRKGCGSRVYQGLTNWSKLIRKILLQLRTYGLPISTFHGVYSIEVGHLTILPSKLFVAG